MTRSDWIMVSAVYFIFGIGTAGACTWMAQDKDNKKYKSDELAAIGLASFIFNPLVVAGFVLYVSAVFARAVFRGVRLLYRRRRPKETLPKAQVVGGADVRR